MATMAPPLVVASAAPYSAMLIMMNAETLPWPTRWLTNEAFTPKSRNSTMGMISTKTRVRRLRVNRRISSPRAVMLKPPRPGARRLLRSGEATAGVLIRMLLR
jgi:hypothetical protein